MRPALDFIAGLVNGLGKRNSARLARRRPGTRLSGLIEALGRFVMLALCVGLGAVALFAATGFPGHSAQASKSPGIVSPSFAPQSMAEVLATDPDAAPRVWKYIVVHHSASVRGSAEIFDEWHRAKGWRGLGYHFVIGNGNDQGDGLIVAGPRWYSQEAGAHANSAEYNEHGIGICLVGNFEEHAPTPAQWDALRALIDKLCLAYEIPRTNIVGHNQIRRGGSTACPGRYLPLERLREGL